MKINIDKELCIGCGSCEAVCPDFFKMDDENKAYFEENKNGDKDCAKEAVDICPTQAIKIEE